jgi:hypothetical protein
MKSTFWIVEKTNLKKTKYIGIDMRGMHVLQKW